jgi:nitroreductase
MSGRACRRRVRASLSPCERGNLRPSVLVPTTPNRPSSWSSPWRYQAANSSRAGCSVLDDLWDRLPRTPVDSSDRRRDTVPPDRRGTDRFHQFDEMITAGHQLDHHARGFVGVEVGMPVAVTLANRVAAARDLEVGERLHDAVHPHRQVLQAAVGVGGEIVAIDRGFVAVLLDDFDLLITGVRKRGRYVRTDRLTVVFSFRTDVLLDEERANPTGDPMSHRLLDVGDDVALLDDRSKECAHGSILTQLVARGDADAAGARGWVMASAPASDIDLAATDHLLTTTRSVRRRLDFDRPVAPEVLEECFDVAIQAPTGSNSQGWHFVVVDDAETKLALANLYRRGFDEYASVPQVPRFDADDPRTEQMRGILGSAAYLNTRLHEVPAMVIPCIEGRWEDLTVFHQAGAYGSIFPAVWSLMLALRARGIGSSLTTLHLMHEREAAEILGLPGDLTQVGLLPVGYYTGTTFREAGRIPARARTHWGRWGRAR